MSPIWRRVSFKSISIGATAVLVVSFAILATSTQADIAEENNAAAAIGIPSTIDPTTSAPAPLSPVTKTRPANPSCIKDVDIGINFNNLFIGAPLSDEQVEQLIEDSIAGTPVTQWIANQIPAQLQELTDQKFITFTYAKIIGARPSQDQLDALTTKLQDNPNRAEMLAYLLGSNPAKRNLAVTSSSFCKFVDTHGGGTQTAPGVVYQNNDIEHIVFVDVNTIDRTFATAEATGLQSTPEFAAVNDLTVAVNANWFRRDGELDGFVVSDGAAYGGDQNPDTGQSGDHDYTALFGFDADHKIHTAWHGETFETPSPDIANAVSGHPSLTHKGLLSSEFKFALGPDTEDVYTLATPNAHSAIGTSALGNILIVSAVDGKRGTGYTALQMAEMMQRAGAHESVMLDGSGSTSLVLNNQEVTSRNDGREVLANVGVSTGDWFSE